MASLGGAFRAGNRLFNGVVRRRTGVRNAGGEDHPGPSYRQMVVVPKSQNIQADMIGGFMWFWILWHFWHDPGAVFGHFPYPDPSQWTDEELGILPEDEE